MIMTTVLYRFEAARCYVPERDCQTVTTIYKEGHYRIGGPKMAELPRLNGIIRALEAGQHALTCFTPAETSSAVAMATSKYDGCVFEMEHQPWDGRLLRDCLQYMLNRAQIAKAAS